MTSAPGRSVIERIGEALRTCVEPVGAGVLAEIVGCSQQAANVSLYQLERLGLAHRIGRARRTPQKSGPASVLWAAVFVAAQEPKRGFVILDRERRARYVDVLFPTEARALAVLEELLAPYDADDPWRARLGVEEVGAGREEAAA